VHRVAELGALGRIGMIFGVLVSTTSALILPRFARCQDAGRLRSRYVLILSGFTCIIILGSLFAKLLPNSLLWLLGAQYAEFGDLVWLAVLATGTASLAGLLYSLNVNKGWIPSAAIIVPVDIANQLVLCMAFDLSTVRGVLLIGVLTPIIPSLMNLFVGIKKLKSMSQSAIAMD
jgi:hypothetical protein